MHRDTTFAHRSHRRHRAFTIAELLVSIAVIAILIGSAFYALRIAKRSATRTQSMNALRQMMTAYSNYVGDHGGRLMPGYVDPTMIGTASNSVIPFAKSQNGLPLSAADSASYVWRLAPYVDYKWDTFMADYRDGALAGFFADGLNSGVYSDIANRPAFGLNSILVGGDAVHGGPAVASLSPWDVSGSSVQLNANRIAAVRMSEVKQPSRLIVFAPSAEVDLAANPLPYHSGTGSILGSAHIRPPYVIFDSAADGGMGDWSSQQWLIDASNALLPAGGADYSAGGGMPVDRTGRGPISLQLSNPAANDDGSRSMGTSIMVGHLDGSVGDFDTLSTIVDTAGAGPQQAAARRRIMQRWSPFAVGVN